MSYSNKTDGMENNSVWQSLLASVEAIEASYDCEGLENLEDRAFRYHQIVKQFIEGDCKRLPQHQQKKYLEHIMKINQSLVNRGISMQSDLIIEQKGVTRHKKACKGYSDTPR